MDCTRIRNRLDDYLDGQLEAAASTAVAGHLAECAECAERFREEEALRQALRDLPVPPPSGDLLAAARREADRRERGRRLWGAGGLGVAAALLLAVAVGLVQRAPAPGGGASGGLSVVAVAPGQTQRVNLVFNSRSRLEDVTLSVRLPAGVELAGHPGKRRITWQTNLEPGRNLLRLPVVVNGAGGVVHADLRYDDTRRSFGLEVRARTDDGSGTAPEGAV
ncbi:MAG TPA: zf-HC2 domain-containing protein [Gammaproteobacteria bacterium]|nr:zf-HC2 domain-containing protein [Gammaproteobacteria bacterium]